MGYDLRIFINKFTKYVIYKDNDGQLITTSEKSNAVETLVWDCLANFAR